MWNVQVRDIKHLNHNVKLILVFMLAMILASFDLGVVSHRTVASQRAPNLWQ